MIKVCQNNSNNKNKNNNSNNKVILKTASAMLARGQKLYQIQQIGPHQRHLFYKRCANSRNRFSAQMKVRIRCVLLLE